MSCCAAVPLGKITELCAGLKWPYSPHPYEFSLSHLGKYHWCFSKGKVRLKEINMRFLTTLAISISY